MDTSQYLSLFLEESAENIDNLNQSMLELEKDPKNADLINQIFRFAHTLKGMAATMGFTNISELTHSMENVLDKLRSGSLQVSTELITVLFECVDKLESMVGNVAEGKDINIDCSEIIKKLNEALIDDQPHITSHDNNNRLELNVYDISILKEAKDRLYNSYEINIILRKDCQLKSARAFLIFNTLQQHGEIVKSEPAAELIEKEEFGQNISLVYLSQREKEFIKKIIDGISEIDSVSVEKVDPQKYEEAPKTEVSVKHDVHADVDSVENTAPSKKLGQSVRVDLDRLDKFMNLVGELVIHRTRLEQISSTYHLGELNETLEQVGRITSDLQDLVMKVRMIPLDRIFSRLPRMMRDLGGELEKDINFVIKGQETELDRTVVDELGESIIHLLRNSVDHGIETREERKRLGKSAEGNVTVTAYQEGNKAVIKVEDDGAGINIQKVRKKAISKGISIEGMSDSDIRNLIFLEGFSTNDKVTDVSGRGVGMDVVKTKIASIGGTVELRSEEGKGTCFIIHLPLTLSIIQALLVKVCGETFAISLGFIEKVINIDKSDIKYSNNREVVVYRDEIIPIVRLSRKLRLKGEKTDEGFLVIVRVGDKQLGLMVDSLIGQQEIVIKPLGKSLKSLKEYVGATILGDGHVTLILDVVSIL